MCLSDEIPDKWSPLIEFIIFFVFQGYNIGAHFGVWIITKTQIVDVTSHTELNTTTNASDATSSFLSNVVSNVASTSSSLLSNNTLLNNTDPFSTDVNNSNSQNVIITISPEEVWQDLLKFREIFYYMCCFGLALFVIHLFILLPNVVKHFLEADPAVLKDEGSHWYYRNVFFMNVLMLIFTSFAFDIPIAVLVIRLLEDIWRGNALTEAQKLDVSGSMVSYSLSGLAFMALYKGMMPLFLWIGNPFCFPCVPLRLLIVLPGGLVALVMTFAPPMGYAKMGLLEFAPAAMQVQLGDLASTFFSIGMIFWGVFFVLIFVISICYYKFCRESSGDDDNCCCCC